jgi:uncharacterized protein YqgV (UPF0045/DUF77 family)
MSSARSAKYMQAIAAYEQADIAEAVGVLDDAQQRMLATLVKKIHNKLEGMKVEVVKRKEKKSEIPTVTKEQQLSALIAKIHKALEKYESTVHVEEWKVEFTVGMKFDDKPFSDIQNHHEQLVKTESTADSVKLLACMERGRLYDFLKFSGNGGWEKLCSDLGICRRTADRYIDFSRIICAYPRLLICGISFETIVCLYRKLQEHLSRDEALSLRLQQPLKQTSIKSDLKLFSRIMLSWKLKIRRLN